MKNALTGALITAIVVVVGKTAHRIGYRKGFRDCEKVVEFTRDLVVGIRNKE
jgi:hypothetical protein